MKLSRRSFVRDGFIAVGVAMLWTMGVSLLGRTEGVVSGLPGYVLYELTEPAKIAISWTVGFVLDIAGLVPKAGGWANPSWVGNSLAIALGILLMVFYWFLLGGFVGLLWRTIRIQVQLTLSKGSHQS